MSVEILHPDRLGPGDVVGPWKILEVIGAGGLGRVFRVENEGKVYALKMAVRLPGEKLLGEEDVDGRCMREATAMLERTPHLHIPRVFQVSRWPDPEAGFLFVIMEYVNGWRFHDWRYEKHPTAAQLVDVLLPIARTLADLHTRGIHHRDLNANNVLIRKVDGRPFMVDFGSVRLPGARTLTQGMPPVDLSVMPPEALEQARAHGDDARFEGGEMADLYAFGVLLYSALTDGYPFNPELAPEKLAAVIRLRVPRAPHRINPKVPLSLSAIALRLLEKRPEDRYESAEALHRALWEASKARTSRAWKTSLDLPESGPAPMTEEEVYERELDARTRLAVEARAAAGDASPVENTADGAANQPSAEEMFARISAVAARRTKVIWNWERVRRPLLGVATACVLVAGLVAVASWWSRYSPPNTAPETAARPPPTMKAALGQEVAPPWKWPDPEEAAVSPEAALTPRTIAARAMPSEDSISVKTLMNSQPKQPSIALRAARGVVGAAITCSALTGCPGAQVRHPPPAEGCPDGAVAAMEKLGIDVRVRHDATFDAIPKNPRAIAVREGRASVHIIGDWKDMPGGTELSGHLIFADRVYGRLTEAEVNGHTIPICMELEDVDGGRGLIRDPNGESETAKVFSTVRVKPVRKFE